MADYTHTNLAELEDMAVEGGFSESQEARFANQDLELESLGVSYQIVKPDKHHAFGHRHQKAEEVYVVLSGFGKIHLEAVASVVQSYSHPFMKLTIDEGRLTH